MQVKGITTYNPTELCHTEEVSSGTPFYGMRDAMNEIHSFGAQSSGLSRVVSRQGGQLPVAIDLTAATQREDELQLSQAAQQVSELLAKLNELPEVRQDVIDRVRGEIDADTYLSEEKIDAAIENLLADL